MDIPVNPWLRNRDRGESDPQFSNDNWRDVEEKSLAQIIKSLKEARRIVNQCTETLEENERNRK